MICTQLFFKLWRNILLSRQLIPPKFSLRLALTVSLLPTCFFIIMRLTSYKNFSGRKIRSKQYPVTFRYIDDVLSLNNSKFGDYVERVYPIELAIKDTTDTVKSASYLDLHLEIDNEGRLKTKPYDKRAFQL